MKKSRSRSRNTLERKQMRQAALLVFTTFLFFVALIFSGCLG